MSLETPELALDEATSRLVRSVDRLSDPEWEAASGLPEWSRAHLVAHLTLNAEALAGVLEGAARGDAVPMYSSQEARDRDIAELAGADPAEIRERMLASTTRFGQAAREMPEDGWPARVERTPGSDRTFRASAVPGMRLREVEIHHVDLDVGYLPSDWPEGFAGLVIEAMTKRLAPTDGFGVYADDTGASWTLGEARDSGDGAVIVSGTAYDLAWWLTGRGDGQGLTSSNGRLPEVTGW